MNPSGNAIGPGTRLAPVIAAPGTAGVGLEGGDAASATPEPQPTDRSVSTERHTRKLIAFTQRWLREKETVKKLMPSLCIPHRYELFKSHLAIVLDANWPMVNPK